MEESRCSGVHVCCECLCFVLIQFELWFMKDQTKKLVLLQQWTASKRVKTSSGHNMVCMNILLPHNKIN